MRLTVKSKLYNLCPRLAREFSLLRSLLDEPPTGSDYWTVAKLIRRRIHLNAAGWDRSCREGRPVNKSGDPIPWMNYEVNSVLDDRLTEGLRIFEFGSGYSTMFFSARVESVTSVEFDRSWFNLTTALVGANAEVIFCAEDIDGAYCRAASSVGGPFDLIVVDGRDRVNCIKQSAALLSAGGVMVLDDSHRPRFDEGVEFMQRLGFHPLQLSGFKPSVTRPHATTVFIRSGNCLGLEIPDAAPRVDATRPAETIQP